MIRTEPEPPETLDVATAKNLRRIPAQRSRPPAGDRFPIRTLATPRIAVTLAVVGTLLLAVVGLASPNDHTLDARLPLSLLPALPGAASTYLTLTAIVLQLLGLLGMLAANRAGWRPSRRQLLTAGTAAVLTLACLTPIGSSDTASYAAYGRIAALGGDPYSSTPGLLGGPYAQLVSSSWLHTPSVYGPIATWIQEGAAMIGGSHPWLTIWLLMVANAVVFIAVGWLLMRQAEDEIRAGLLWMANPLLIGQLVGGGHLDTYVAALALCAVLSVRRGTLLHHDLLAGAAVGLAAGVKVSAALIGVGLIWPLVRQRAWVRALRITVVSVVTVVALYFTYGLHALAPLSTASDLVSVPSVWQVVQHFGRLTIGQASTAFAISAIWPVLLLLVAALALRRIPGKPPGVVAVPFALIFAWIVVAPWCMPWYTAAAWPLAALLPRSPLTRWLALITAALALVHNTGGHGWVW
ncbi:hypothetical protein ABIA33_005645 [Streptacidiphilus sp. MAP12-16]|uniref:glycosyltransferase 87 family protein n=1 Tax=Streptacidiphilus sp. MAP12-16 TaxID=3156300 RepID=UPI003511B527